MPCCCETNLKAAYYAGCFGLGLGIGNLPIAEGVLDYVAGAIGVVVSIVLIVGAKAPNATALLVWMALACLRCIAGVNIMFRI